MQWEYHQPVFECDKINYELLNYAPWSGHRNFLYDFLAFFKFKKIAELGSHYGCSAFTFCQADKDLNLNMDMYFVDTWQGDDFTKKYDNDVFSIFKRTLDEIYPSQNANMVRMTFDEAVQNYENGFFDVIHIDGSHHYDDVKRDFDNWKSKVKENGVILFHDISSDKVFDELMGSHIFWQELKQEYKYTFEFDFSFGLGILFLSEDKYNAFINAFEPFKYQRINNNLAVEYKDQLRKDYFQKIDFNRHIDSLYKQLEIKDTHLNNYAEDVKKKDCYISELEKDKVEAQKIYSKYEETVQGKDRYIKELEDIKQQLQARAEEISKMYDETCAKYEETVQGKDHYIQELEDAKVQAQKTFEGYEDTINNYKEMVTGKDSRINELEHELSRCLSYKIKKFFKK